jgi:hypothetical protein
MIKSVSRRLLIWRGVLLLGDIVCYFLSVVFALYFNSITSKDPFGFLLQFIIKFILVATTYFLALYIAKLSKKPFGSCRNLLFGNFWSSLLVVF